MFVFFLFCFSKRIQVDGGGVSQYLLGLAERVAESGEVINVAESLEVEPKSSGSIKSLLAMPIRNSNYQIIGKFVFIYCSLFVYF